MSELNVFARNLRYLRKKRDLSFRELAKMTGISKSMLEQYEKQIVDPGLSKVNALARFFGVPTETLTGDKLLEDEDRGRERESKYNANDSGVVNF